MAIKKSSQYVFFQELTNLANETKLAKENTVYKKALQIKLIELAIKYENALIFTIALSGNLSVGFGNAFMNHALTKAKFENFYIDQAQKSINFLSPDRQLLETTSDMSEEEKV